MELLGLFNLDIEQILVSPLMLAATLFQIWMLVDAIRRREYIWAVFIFFFSILSAVLYFFMVYRPAAAASPSKGFELPGAHDRRRIKELEAQIHHLDKAHHHAQLGDIYFQQGKLDKAEASYRAAMERDPEDPDTRSHFAQCLLRQNRVEEALPLLERVAREDPRHEYGHTLMAMAEAYAQLNRIDEAIRAWRQVLENHSYSRARVQLAELHLARGEVSEARQLVDEVLADYVHTPAFQRKREKVWVNRARDLQRKLG